MATLLCSLIRARCKRSPRVTSLLLGLWIIFGQSSLVWAAPGAKQILTQDIHGVVTLEKTRQPHEILRTIRIATDGKLLIEPGATVVVAPGAKIEVVGILAVTEASEDERAIIRNGVAGQLWGGISLEKGGSGSFSGLEILGADVGITSRQDGPAVDIENCVITTCMNGVRLERSRDRHQIRNSVVAANRKNGVVVSLAKFDLIQSTVMGNGEHGILLKYYGNGKIQNCTITQNPTAIRSTVYETKLEMAGTNIAGNRISISVNTPNDFRCRGNFWGAVNPIAIAAQIHDGYDKPGRGRVDFTEFAAKPFSEAGAQLKQGP